MKKFILALSFLFLGYGFSFSQCNPAIPSNAFIVNTTQTTGFGGSPIWVCSSDTLTSNGGSNTIFLETGAYLYAGGGSNTVYVPHGATINLSSGSNIIYYVNLSDIISPGGGPILNSCPSINYDYSSAPTGGCALTTGIFSEKEKAAIKIFPNPATSEIQISPDVSGFGFRIYSIEIYDVPGKKIHSEQLQTVSVNISHLTPGMYFVKVKGEKEERVGKFVKE